MSEVVADIRGSGPAVVLLHGQPGSAADWAMVSQRLEAEFTVIVPDRPGYGRTGGHARGFRANAAAALSVMDQQGIATATIVGHSWGGGVALAFALATPSRISGMVLVSSVSPIEEATRFDRLLATEPLGSAVAAVTMFVASRALSLPPARQYVERRLRESGSESMAAAFDAWRDPQSWRSFVTEQRSLIDELPLLAQGLSSIRTPTELVVGESDRIVPATSGRRLAARIPSAQLILVADAGHMLSHEAPDAIVASIKRVAGGASRPGEAG
jgi:pimeloyl-ACP methyl ester carboxylesterase